MEKELSTSNLIWGIFLIITSFMSLVVIGINAF